MYGKLREQYILPMIHKCYANLLIGDDFSNANKFISPIINWDVVLAGSSLLGILDQCFIRTLLDLEESLINLTHLLKK